MTFEQWWDEQTIFTEGRGIAEAGWDAATESAVPDGYVLVPIEPTEAMVEAAEQYVNDLYGDDRYRIYKAMIKSAQENNDDLS